MDNEIQTRMEQLKKALAIDEKRQHIAKYKAELLDEALWKDWEKGQKISQDLAH
jgi:hypothetical protein